MLRPLPVVIPLNTLARRWPGRGRGRGGGGGCRRSLGCHGGWCRTARSGFLLRRRFFSRSRRRCRLQFDKHGIGHQACVILGGRDHPHRHGLRLKTGKSEAHRKLARHHGERTRSPAGLPKRGACLRTSRLGFELHIDRGGGGLEEARSVERHPTWHSGACGKTQTAGRDRDDTFHNRHRPLTRLNGHFTTGGGSM